MKSLFGCFSLSNPRKFTFFFLIYILFCESSLLSWRRDNPTLVWTSIWNQNLILLPRTEAKRNWKRLFISDKTKGKLVREKKKLKDLVPIYSKENEKLKGKISFFEFIFFFPLHIHEPWKIIFHTRNCLEINIYEPRAREMHYFKW